MQPSPLSRLPGEVRLTIWTELPVSLQAQLQPCAQFLHKDIAFLWSTRAFAETYVDRVLLRLTREHDEIVAWYMQDAGNQVEERARQVERMLHLLHVRRWLWGCREQLHGQAQRARRASEPAMMRHYTMKPSLEMQESMEPARTMDGDGSFGCRGKAFIKQVFRRARATRPLSGQGLWTQDVQKLLYPGASSVPET